MAQTGEVTCDNCSQVIITANWTQIRSGLFVLPVIDLCDTCATGMATTLKIERTPNG